MKDCLICGNAKFEICCKCMDAMMYRLSQADLLSEFGQEESYSYSNNSFLDGYTNEDLAKILVTRDAGTLFHLKESLWSPEIMILALDGGEDLPGNFLKDYVESFASLKDVPEDLRTVAVCREFMLRNSSNVEFIPKHIQLDEQTKKRMKRQMPERFWDASLYLDLINDTDDLLVPPERIQSEEFWISVVKRDFRYFEIVPPKFITENVCIRAVQTNPFNITRVPLQLRSDTVVLEALDSMRRW